MNTEFVNDGDFTNIPKIPKDLKDRLKKLNFISPFEKARVIGERAYQIANGTGPKPDKETLENIDQFALNGKVEAIAMKEYAEHKIQFKLRRFFKISGLLYHYDFDLRNLRETTEDIPETLVVSGDYNISLDPMLTLKGEEPSFTFLTEDEINFVIQQIFVNDDEDVIIQPANKILVMRGITVDIQDLMKENLTTHIKDNLRVIKFPNNVAALMDIATYTAMRHNQSLIPARMAIGFQMADVLVDTQATISSFHNPGKKKAAVSAIREIEMMLQVAQTNYSDFLVFKPGSMNIVKLAELIYRDADVLIEHALKDVQEIILDDVDSENSTSKETIRLLLNVEDDASLKLRFGNHAVRMTFDALKLQSHGITLSDVAESVNKVMDQHGVVNTNIDTVRQMKPFKVVPESESSGNILVFTELQIIAGEGTRQTAAQHVLRDSFIHNTIPKFLNPTSLKPNAIKGITDFFPQSFTTSSFVTRETWRDTIYAQRTQPFENEQRIEGGIPRKRSSKKIKVEMQRWIWDLQIGDLNYLMEDPKQIFVNLLQAIFDDFDADIGFQSVVQNELDMLQQRVDAASGEEKIPIQRKLAYLQKKSLRQVYISLTEVTMTRSRQRLNELQQSLQQQIIKRRVSSAVKDYMQENKIRDVQDVPQDILAETETQMKNMVEGQFTEVKASKGPLTYLQAWHEYVVLKQNEAMRNLYMENDATAAEEQKDEHQPQVRLDLLRLMQPWKQGSFAQEQDFKLRKILDYGEVFTVLTEGSNYLDTINIPDVDARRSYPTNPLEIHRYLGAEATYNLTLRGFIEQFSKNGREADVRHIQVAVGVMNHTGALDSLTSLSLGETEQSTTRWAMRSGAPAHYMSGAQRRLVEDFRTNVMSALVHGMKPIIGTGGTMVIQS